MPDENTLGKPDDASAAPGNRPPRPLFS